MPAVQTPRLIHDRSGLLKDLTTSIRICGDIAESYEKNLAPLLLLHGGPGSTRNYLEVFDDLAVEGRAIISYDQLGCGRSSYNLSSKFYTMDVWLDQLEDVIDYLGLDEFFLFGQSFGGMLAQEYALHRCPDLDKIKGLVLSSTLACSSAWAFEQRRQAQSLGEEIYEDMLLCEKLGRFNHPTYLRAYEEFTKRFIFSPDEDTFEVPECVLRERNFGERAYEVAWGGDELHPIGNLAFWDVSEELPALEMPVLVTRGDSDLCTESIAQVFLDMLPQAQCQVFSPARHMPFIECRAAYMERMKIWLSSVEYGLYS